MAGFPARTHPADEPETRTDFADVVRTAVDAVKFGPAGGTGGVALGRAGGNDAGERLLPPPAAAVPIVTATSPAATTTTAPSQVASGRPAASDRGARPARRVPQLVGPRDEDGFQRLLSAYCQEEGQRTAVLLPDRRDRAAGEWACVRAVTFARINLDDVCREEHGSGARARRLRPEDARSWRCFDG